MTLLKLITLNFGTWNGGASGGRLRRIYRRIYINGYKWTPFVTICFRWLPINDKLNALANRPPIFCQDEALQEKHEQKLEKRIVSVVKH